jgi:hypothetical protein
MNKARLKKKQKNELFKTYSAMNLKEKSSFRKLGCYLFGTFKLNYQNNEEGC